MDPARQVFFSLGYEARLLIGHGRYLKTKSPIGWRSIVTGVSVTIDDDTTVTTS